MIIRKCITLIQMLKSYINKVSVTWTLKNNIEFGVKIYNEGNELKIGQTTIRSNVLINTSGNGEMSIGNGCFFNRNCIISCRDSIHIGDGCIFGPNVCVYDHDHNYTQNGIQSGYQCEGVVIDDGCWIGAGAIILRGTHIGRNSIVAAGAIIKGCYPESSLIYSVNEVRVKQLEKNNG